MQELLGRLSALDPEASLGLRVIACFDELILGRVNTHALLSAAAALAACPAGFAQDNPARCVRVSPRGDQLDGTLPVHMEAAVSEDGVRVWLEREGPAQANDAIILERLALALRVRHGLSRAHEERRWLSVLLDGAAGADERMDAAGHVGLSSHATYRVLAAPLFATWQRHPSGPEDVVPTPVGPIHALVVPASGNDAAASPLGVGVVAPADRLHHSFRTALVALRLCQPPDEPVVHADDYGGLVDLLADVPAGADVSDTKPLDEVMSHPWGAATLAAIVRAGSVREAARLAGVHHSTMQARLEQVSSAVGYDPLDGMGRTRIGVAYLVWRLRHSRVLELPAPAPRQP